MFVFFFVIVFFEVLFIVIFMIVIILKWLVFLDNVEDSVKWLK